MMNKKTIKDFLKPTKIKVIIFLGLMSILPLAIFIYCFLNDGLHVHLAPYDQNIITLSLFAYVMLPILLGGALLGGICAPDCGPCSFIQLFGGIIIYYLLFYIIACRISKYLKTKNNNSKIAM